MALIALGAQHEYYRLSAGCSATALQPIGLSVSAALVVAVLHPSWWPLVAGLLVAGLAVSPFLCSADAYLQRIAATVFGSVYPAGGLIALLALREHVALPSAAAVAATVWVVFAVWGTDIFAYFVGKYLGQRKLAPAISPNKTWAGAVGGVGGALTAGALYWMSGAFWAAPMVPLLHIVLLSVLLAGATQCGDLIQSLLKRTANTKDAGGLLPGHGGFFDRFDGMALAAPVALIYLHLLLG